MPHHLSRRPARRGLSLALVAGALAVLAPSAHAALPGTGLRLIVSGAPSTIQAGDSLTVKTTVTNSESRTARSPRYYVGLTRSSTARSSVGRLATRNLPPFRAKRKASYSLKVRIRPDSSGDYRIVVCGTQSGRKARCILASGLTVTKIPKPPVPAPPAPAPTPPAPAPLPLDTQLRNAITPAALTEHTSALQAIADANGGNRAAGTAGYDDSVGYVFSRLVKAGYSPKLNQFSFINFTENTPPQLSANTGATYTTPDDFASLSFSGSGDTGAAKPIVPVDLGVTPTPDDAPASSNTSGCEPADFAGFAAGSIALIKRGTCSFFDKAKNAVDAGASGVIIFNEGQPGRDGPLGGTLSDPVPNGEKIPVVGTTAAVGEAIAAKAGATGRVKTDSQNEPTVSYNVTADTATGDPENTVLIGSHLDSVDAGPGINDNGSGSAFNLALAEQMAALKVEPVNRVRFAWWGAEEAGLKGSTAYAFSLSDAEFNRIGLNLNFDMLASPNFARLIYDGDFSDSPEPAGAALAPGSADVEQAFKAQFDAAGLATLPTGFDGRSDYKVFQDNGVPAGGLFSGAEEIKTEEEAGLFGGTAGLAFDPNYHQAGDVAGNLNLTGFEQLADAAASVSLQYALAPTLPAKYSAPALKAAGRSATKGRRGTGSGSGWATGSSAS